MLQRFFTAIAWIIVYFAPTYPLLLIIGFFVVADTITGVQAAIKRGERFSSKRLRDVIPKFSAYGIGVLVAHVIQINFFPDFPAMKCIAGLVAYTELKSIDENIKSITGLSFFKAVLDKFPSAK